MSGARRGAGERSFRFRLRLPVPVWVPRRLCQLAVVAIVLALPIVARYHHYLSARALDKTIEKWDGELAGDVLAGADLVLRYGIPDGEGGVATRRPRKRVLARCQEFYGSPWSARLFGATVTDPLAAAESGAATGSFTMVLAMGILIPIGASVVLGRVYCGWVCPGGFLFDVAGLLRRSLRFLEIRGANVRLGKAPKYVVLGAGLALAYVTSLPFLHYLYPPAILGRETRAWVQAFFDRAEQGDMGLAVAGLSAASLFLVGLVLVEVLVAPGVWCRSLCPGGAIYSILGRFRLVRVRRNIDACDPCGLCTKACPRALDPMRDATGMECDSCGVCIDVCPDDALGYRLALTSAGYRPSERRAKREEVGSHA